MISNNDEIENLIVSIQFDRWVFGFPTRFTIVSHKHKDHDPFSGSISFPEPLIFGEKFRERFAQRVSEIRRGKLPDHFNLSDGDFTTIKNVRVRCLGHNSVFRLSRTETDFLHADWWVLSTKKIMVLFVGELDGAELPALSKLLEEAKELDALLLPSYGKIENFNTHRLSDPEQLQREIAELAERERRKGRAVFALPHPVIQKWCDRAANKI